MDIQIDTREKPSAIKRIIADFERAKINYYKSKLYVGDYMSLDNPRLIIDRKKDLGELVSNLGKVPVKDKNGRYRKDEDGKNIIPYDRFIRELEKAQRANIRLIILCEHSEKVKSIEDVINWDNPRLKQSPLAMSGERLYRHMRVLENRYGIGFVFCNKRNTGKKIIELLRE